MSFCSDSTERFGSAHTGDRDAERGLAEIPELIGDCDSDRKVAGTARMTSTGKRFRQPGGQQEVPPTTWRNSVAT